MKICPVSPQCLHTYLLEPFLEGVERVNLAWQGVRFHQVAAVPPKIDLKERLILLVVGAVLLLPFINNVVWAFWQVFGTPEKLSDPYVPETKPPPPSPPPPPAPRPGHARRATLVYLPPLASPPEKKEVETFVFLEDHPTQKGKKIEVTTDLQSDGAFTRITQQSALEHSQSVYGSNGSIITYQHQAGDRNFLISLNDGKLDTTLTRANNKTFKLQAGYSWIQQPIFGFRKFLSSDQESIHFYCVLPENPIGNWLEAPPVLLKASATKKGKENLPGIGEVIKVIVAPTELPYSAGRAGILWFDPETHILKKFIVPGMPGTAEKGGVLLRHRRSPAQERPESPAR